jgi:hypothetical protein
MAPVRAVIAMSNNWKVHLKDANGDPCCKQRIRVNLSLTNNPDGVTCARCKPYAQLQTVNDYHALKREWRPCPCSASSPPKFVHTDTCPARKL